MKKQRIFTLIAMGLVALFLAGGLVVAVAEDNPSAVVPFEGYRVRDSQIAGPTKILGCRLMRSSQEAYWKVYTNNDLVSGEWVNLDTKANLKVIKYEDEEGVLVDCDPSERFDYTPAGLVTGGPGVVHGPFTLSPDPDLATGVWEGVWKVITHPDGTRFLTATAQGIGGDLEGLTLKVSTNIVPGTFTPPQVPFNGFIVYPPSADGG